MLFHAFRVVYTVKELDSHAKHGQSKKKERFGSMTEYFCAKNLPSGFFYKFLKVFSIMVLPNVMRGGTPYMGISPRRAHLRTHRPARE